MKIKDVQIDGFGVWSGMSVHSMPDTMTVFYGPNEAGKTTLMQFLRTMFYGFTADRRGRYLPPVHGGKPGGAIRVTGPGGGYEITRRATLDQNGAAGTLTVTGSDGLSQGQHRLAMLLGQVDESIFTNVFAIGLRELQELSTLDDTAAADELYKLSSGLDRVSLVDVTRQLRAGRQTLVGPTPDHGQLQELLLRKEKLKDEIDSLTASGRRWSELAALRTSQQAELDELKERIAQWELEAKSYEVAIQVRPQWLKRADLEEQLEALNARTDLPESLADQLAALAEQRGERENKLADVKRQRSALRDEARKLPLRRGLLDLAAKIEAAVEQTPWISSLHKNIQRLESQLDQTREQLLEDAARLGVSEEDQQALLDDRRLSRMPDLSRQTINQLSEPASEVRIWSSRLKQAKQQCDTEKKELDRLEQELHEEVAARGKSDIKDALQASGEIVAQLRKRIQIQETLDKQIARKEQLEEEAIDLTCDEALPVERSFLMGILFVGGAFLFLWGLGKLLPFFNTAEQIDSQSGLLFVVCGMFMLFFGLMWSNVLDRSTVSNLESVEDQIDAIRKEIRKTEAERDELERRLPRHDAPLEMRLKDAEKEVASLESLLPLQHNQRAVADRYKAARKRAAQAAESLRAAKVAWQRTLTQLGLAESMSPRSIRIMAEGYDSLLQTKRRLQNLEEEIETRQIELGSITQRVHALFQQAFAAKAASDEMASGSRAARQRETQEAAQHDSELDDAEEFSGRRAAPLPSQADGLSLATPVKAGVDAANQALDQLSQLQALVSSQEQYIRQKRELHEQDQQLAKQMSAIERSIEKIQRTHHALLAEHKCESEEYLHEQLELKARHEALSEELAEFGERIQAVIGGAVPYETVQRLLGGSGAHDLEKRWEAIGQRTQQAEQRVDLLHQRQGEIGQEMKSLASQSRLAEAKLELASVENQVKACAAHWQTLAVTTSLLDRVCEVYETERQPETLREASAFLHQLTEGKYVRIWTPLGKNQLRIDNADGTALPLEVLSRGTREAVFISLRLSLAAAYARRGVTIPLVLDDVLVNFDSVRAVSAARVLRDFAALGHQVIMFTCHEHIMRIFYDNDVQVRVLPPQGSPGEAEVFHLEPEESPAEFNYPIAEMEPAQEEPPELEPAVEADAPDVVEVQDVEPAREMAAEDVSEPIEDEAEGEVTEEEPQPPTPAPPPRTPAKVKRPVVILDPQPEIDWLWYECSSEPELSEDGWVEAEDQVDDKQTPGDLWWNNERESSALSNRAVS